MRFYDLGYAVKRKTARNAEVFCLKSIPAGRLQLKCSNENCDYVKNGERKKGR